MKKVVAGFFVSTLFFCAAEGVTMSIAPSSVYLQYTGVGQMAQTTFLCAGISASDVSYTFDKVISLKITRLTRRETPSQTPIIIAFIEPGEGARIPQTQETTDIQNRATVTGTVDSVDFTQSNLQLQFDTNAIQCDDVGQYTCTFTYRDWVLNQHTAESSMNLSVNALPSDVTLSATRFGATVEGPVNNPYPMSEDDEMEFLCNGNIGSSTSLQFEWWTTGYMGLIKFRPEIQSNAVEIQGEPTQGSTACTYLRITTMRYNITRTDRNRGSLTVMCFASVIPPSPAPSYPLNSTAFYITIAGGVHDRGENGTREVVTLDGGPYFNMAVDNKAKLAAMVGTMGVATVALLVVEI